MSHSLSHNGVNSALDGFTYITKMILKEALSKCMDKKSATFGTALAHS